MEQKVSRKRRELVIDGADDDDDDDLDASRIVASVITTFLRRLSVALDFKHLIVLQTLLNEIVQAQEALFLDYQPFALASFKFRLVPDFS